MNFTVLKTFRDKSTLQSHKTGHIYKTDDAKRAAELQSKGWIGEEVQEESSVLEQNVANIKQTITADFSHESLEALLQQEVGGENRKGVIEHIQSLLKEND